MRLFAAIDLDDRGRESVAAEQQRLKRAFGGADRSLKWVAAEQLHVTLVFAGSVDDVRAAAIVETMREAIPAPSFTMVFEGIGVFPPRGAPNVLWLGVGAGADDAVAIQSAVATRLERHGIARERRPYRPHLTLARWRASRPADRRLVEGAEHGREIARVRVTSVTLFQSQLSSAGSKYTVLAQSPLRT